MKISINDKRVEKDNKFEKYFDTLVLVFTLVALTLLLAFSDIKNFNNEEQMYSEEYVSAFKESPMYEILGFTDTGEGEQG